MNKRIETMAGQRVLITGGTSGIGLALAANMSHLGANVAVCGRDATRLAEVAMSLGVDTVQCDIADRASLRRLVDEVDAALGGLDVLVHNAAIQRSVSFGSNTTTADGHGTLSRELEVNLAGPIELTALALPLLASTVGTRPPTVVFITSVLATAPKSSAPIYCASKAGLRSFAKALRYQLASSGIRVLEVVPPVVDTPMTAGRDETKVSPNDVALQMIAAIADGRDELLIGKARLARLLHRIAPRFFASMMAPK